MNKKRPESTKLEKEGKLSFKKIVSPYFIHFFIKGLTSSVLFGLAIVIYMVIDKQLNDSLPDLVVNLIFWLMFLYWILIFGGYIIGLIRVNRDKKKKNSKSKKLKWGIVIVVLFLVLLNGGYLSSFINIYPFIEYGEKETVLRCNHSGKDYSVAVKTYSNIDNYYRGYNYSNRIKYLQDSDYSIFYYVNPKDNLIKNILSNVSKIAKQNNLNKDQELELAMCLVQNINYDYKKSDVVLNQTGNTSATEQLPYNTVHSNSGICTDKTYLGLAILKEMGYGASVMEFDNHMALGLKVPREYSTFDSEYAIMELTNIGFAPGNVPAKIDDKGVPSSNIDQLNSLFEGTDPSIIPDSIQEIDPPKKILKAFDGREYSRIAEVKQLENKIDEFYNVLISQKAGLQSSYSNIGYWERIQEQRYQEYLSTSETTRTCRPFCHYYPYFYCEDVCYSSPNYLRNLKYSSYSTAYDNYENAINNYNNLVNAYNSNLEKLNNLVELYSKYQYN